jgi:hypothetical protein
MEYLFSLISDPIIFVIIGIFICLFSFISLLSGVKKRNY